MTRDRLNELKKKVVDFKEVCKDMKILADRLNELPKGQLKKVLTDDIREILEKYGVKI